AFVVLATVCGACGASVGSARLSNAKKLTVQNPFPSRAALEQLAQAPLKPLPGRAVASAPSWVVEPETSTEPPLVEQRLPDLAGSSANGAHVTRELRCVARELARF